MNAYLRTILLQINLVCQRTTLKTRLFETFESMPLTLRDRSAIEDDTRSKPQMEPQLSGKVRFKRLSIKPDQSVAKDISERPCAISECEFKQNIGNWIIHMQEKIPLLSYTERNKIFNYSWLFIFIFIFHL